MENLIKSYKGFNKDMACKDKQYEEGKEYSEERAKACDCGMHACEYPLENRHLECIFLTYRQER